MSRITLTLANTIATQLMKKKRNKENALKDKLGEYAYQCLKTRVPKEIISLYEKKVGNDYFKTSNYGYFTGVGLGYTSIYFTPNIPVKQNGATQVTDREATKLADLQYKWKEEVKANNELQKEIERTLVGLRTYKRVREEFKEAGKYLPVENLVKNTTSLVANIDKLRNKLK